MSHEILVAARDPFANAPVLPYELASQWFARARPIASRHAVFLLCVTGLVLLARWQLDLFGHGELIVLSYFTDAILFTWVFMGLQARDADPAARVGAAGRHALQGRWRALALCGLWGLPAAMVSHSLFAAAPDLIKVLVLLLGNNLVGLLALLLAVVAAAYATFLLSLLPVLAAIQAGRDAQAGFRVAGLWAFRALRAGRRPLAAVFISFLVGCVLAGAVLTYAYGHIPAAVWLQYPGLDETLGYWYPWPGLFVALYVFLALLHPMAQDMLTAADVDLSDEILATHHKDAHGERHVDWLLRWAGFALRAGAALCLLLGLLYDSVLGGNNWLEWAGSALVLYVGGKLLAFWGRRQPSPAAAPAAGEPDATAAALPTGVRVILALLKLAQWLSLLGLAGLQMLLFLASAVSGNGAGAGDLLLWIVLVPLACYLARKGLERRYRR